MKRFAFGTAIVLAVSLALYIFILPHTGQTVIVPIGAGLTESAQRGTYVATAAGCYACHTDTKNTGHPYAGGRPFKTPIGTVNSSNITPDRETGIGG